MSNTVQAARRRKRRAVAVTLVTLISTLGLAESAHRVWRSLSGWSYDGEATRTWYVQARNIATQTVPMPAGASASDPVAPEHWILDPYLGFDIDVTDGLIERELVLRDQNKQDTRWIVVLGGSVAAIFTSLGAETFVDVLADDPRFKDQKILMWSHARGGYKQPQQVNEFVFLLSLGLQPAAVINIDGFNEVALGNENARNGIHPLYPSRTHWLHLIGASASDEEAAELLIELRESRRRTVRLVDLGLNLGLWRSSVVGTLWQRMLRSSMHTTSDAQAAYTRRLSASGIEQGLSGPPIHGGPENGLAITVEGWAQSSACIQAICTARGIPYLHVLQPTLHDEGSKPVTAEERERGSAAPEWIDGVRHGYSLLRERGARLPSEGVNFVDASRIFADVHETLFYDVCHFGKAGNEIFARFIADAFLKTLPPAPR